jgi:hypothetical protein
MSGSHKSEIGDEQSASWLAKLGGSVMSRRRGAASAGDEPRGLEPALAVPLGTEIVDRPSGRVTVEEPDSEQDGTCCRPRGRRWEPGARTSSNMAAGRDCRSRPQSHAEAREADVNGRG